MDGSDLGANARGISNFKPGLQISMGRCEHLFKVMVRRDGPDGVLGEKLLNSTHPLQHLNYIAIVSFSFCPHQTNIYRVTPRIWSLNP